MYMCIHPLFRHAKFLAYMPKLVGIFVFGTYLAITCEIEFAVDCAWAYIYKMLGLYTHVACWLCELYFECGSYIYSAIYIQYVYNAPC